MATQPQTTFSDYVIADIALADFGRKEIEIAETEMPGLMALRDGVRRVEAAEGRADHRLAAHDDPDRGADRDADRAWRRSALGVVQHLLDPGPCRRGDRRDRRAGVRGQGRDASRNIGTMSAGSSTGGRTQTCNMILDDGGDATMFALWGARVEAGEDAVRADQRGRGDFRRDAEALPRRASGLPHQDRRGDQGRVGGDHHRRPPPLRARQEGQASRSRRSTSTTASPSRSSTISTAARKAWSTRSAAPPT